TRLSQGVHTDYVVIVSYRHLGLLARLRHQEFIKRVEGEDERRIGGGRLTRPDRRATTRGRITDQGGPHRDLSRRNVGDLVPSFRAGTGDERRPHNGHARADEWLPGGLISDAARDGALLGSPDGADAAGEAAEHQERAQRGT